jgi:hypothetical protein
VGRVPNGWKYSLVAACYRRYLGDAKNLRNHGTTSTMLCGSGVASPTAARHRVGGGNVSMVVVRIGACLCACVRCVVVAKKRKVRLTTLIRWN